MFGEFEIYCHTDETYTTKSLGMEPNQNDYDIRLGSINLDHILGFYPDKKNENTIVEIDGQTFEVALNYSDFKLKLQQYFKP